MKVFLDANVLFSAAQEGSVMHRLVQALAAGHQVISSDYSFEEASRNISTKRPDWRKGFTGACVAIEIVQSVDQPLSVDIIEKDRPILATALRNGGDYLVTGDKRHFGHLFGKRIGSLKVISPLMLAKLLAEERHS